jgi:hypothetical protein
LERFTGGTAGDEFVECVVVGSHGSQPSHLVSRE